MDNEVLDRIAAAIESLDKPGLPEMDVYRLTVALESTARNLDKLVALLVTPQVVAQVAAPQVVAQAEPEEKAVTQAAAPEAPGEEAPVVGRTRTEETLYREELKKELREKGIAFKEAAKTTTLEKLVAASRQEAVPTCCTPQSRTWAKIEVNGGTREVLYCTTCRRIGRVLENGVEQEVAPNAKFTPPAPAAQTPPEPEPSNVIAHTMDQVRGAIVGLAKVRGRDVAREILEKYGHATLIPEVDMQYYAAIIAKCEEAMKEGVRNAA